MRAVVFAILICLSAFLSGCASNGTTPMISEPGAQGEEYRLAPGDKIQVSVFGEDTLTGDYVLTSAGNLSFPLVGKLSAGGRTVEELQAVLTRALADGYVNDPRISIQVVTFRPFYILGEVNKPGEYPVATGLTIQQAVAGAGGYTYRANTKRVFLKRSTGVQEVLVDLRDTPNIIVRAGDTIRITERYF